MGRFDVLRGVQNPQPSRTSVWSAPDSSPPHCQRGCGGAPQLTLSTLSVTITARARTQAEHAHAHITPECPTAHTHVVTVDIVRSRPVVHRRVLFVARWFSTSAVSTDAHVSELDGAAVALSWRQERQAARSSCLDMRPSQTRLGWQAYAVYERRERILRCPKCANARIVPVVYGYPVGSDPLHCVTPRGPFGAAVTGQLTCVFGFARRRSLCG